MSITCSSNSHSQKKTLQFHEDRITNLPDSILHHILSFLPAKDAIATTLLSTKWKNLWFSIQNLQFHDYSTKNFIQFVSRVLLIHTTNNPTINRFHLSITNRYDSYQVYSWISEVLSRKVRELILDVSFTNLLLPPSLFTSESLNVLKIDTIHSLRFPPKICFSALKVLHLCFVRIGGIEEEIQHMFITCPVLEELFLLECEWSIVKSVTISAPVLKRLVVDDDIGCEDAGLYNCGIEIFTDNLVSFDLKSDFPYEYSLNNLSSMVSANIDVLENRSSLSLEMRCLNKLIRGIFHVKNIMLSCGTLVALSRANLLASLATFPNLTNLRVNVSGGAS